MIHLLINQGFRNAVLSLAIKTIKLRYKNSLLGVFWSMLNPIIFLLILIVVFKEVSNMPNYALYALSGLVFWNFISAAILQVVTSFVDNAGILKSVNINPICFPLAAALAAVFNLFLTLVPFGVVMFFLGYSLHLPSLLFVFPFILITTLFITGLGLTMATANVYFRDVQLLWTTIIPAFFYFTPIAFSIEIIPEHMRRYIKINPFYYFIESYHDIFYYGQMPSLYNVMVCLLLSGITLLLGFVFFKKYKKGFISNL